jgi:magnesium-transporting ATPase (P-type)
MLKPTWEPEGASSISPVLSQVTDLLVDESSFTGEAEPCSKTDSPLPDSGDLSTLSNIVFMGTLVQCGKGQVSRVPGLQSTARALGFHTSLS